MRNSFVAVMVAVFCICLGWTAEAKSSPHAKARSQSHAATPAHGKRASSGKTTGGTGRHATSLVSKSGRRRTVAGAHHGRHHGTSVAARKKSSHLAHAHTRYAYPMGFFMLNSPDFDRSPLVRDKADNIASSFNRGFADEYAARSLVRAGIVTYHPLHGGIFWRREPIKYIIIHSTETGIPVSAMNVINGWNSAGRRHPGAQYVVDRDGTIYQAVDPDLGTVHINIFKTLPGINNDNSIGIEMNHTGRQDYPTSEREAVIRLVTYLQGRYKVPDQNVITHRYAQQGDHTDPVNFDWDGFLVSKNSFKSHAIAYKMNRMKDDVKHWSNVESTAEQVAPAEHVPPEQVPPAYLQPHKALKEAQVGATSESATTTQAPAPVDSATPASASESAATATPAVIPSATPVTPARSVTPATPPSPSTPPTIMMMPSPQAAPSPKTAPLRGPIDELAPDLKTPTQPLSQ